MNRKLSKGIIATLILIVAATGTAGFLIEYFGTQMVISTEVSISSLTPESISCVEPLFEGGEYESCISIDASNQNGITRNITWDLNQPEEIDCYLALIEDSNHTKLTEIAIEGDTTVNFDVMCRVLPLAAPDDYNMSISFVPVME